METQIFDISGGAQCKLQEGALERVCGILKNGGVVAVPTETVYGLAANAFDEDAVKKIFAAKGRPQDNPLIVHIDGYGMLDSVARSFDARARRLGARYWPGPLTMVLPKSAGVPAVTSAGLDTVGVRMPSHPVIREIIGRCGFPLAAPSANLSGTPSTTSARHCIEDLQGRVDAIVCAGESEVGLESTVVSLAGAVPRLLRPGAVTLDELREVLGAVEVDPAVDGELDPRTPPGSPGMKYRHYAPRNALVRLVRGDTAAFCRYVNGAAGEHDAALCFEGEERGLQVLAVPLGRLGEYAAMAHALFGELREFDREGVQTVYVHCPGPEGLGLAVYNRLLRAAAFDVVTVW